MIVCIRYVEGEPFNDKRYYISNQKLKDLKDGMLEFN